MENKFTLKDGSQLILPTIIEGNYANHWKDASFTNEDHHNSYEAISSSSLKVLLDSPYSYLSQVNDRQNGIHKEPTKSMKFGTLAHMAVLEPEKFREKFLIAPDFGDQRKKENKLSKELWFLQTPKDAVIFYSQEEYDDFIGVISAIASHPKARNMFKEGVSEVSGFYKDEKTGLLCRFRPDFISTRPDLNLFLDFKTARSSAYREFQNQIWAYRYDIQIVMYREGIKAITGRYPDASAWVVTENKRPYEVAVYEADYKLIEVATEWYHFALALLKKCIVEKNFPQRQREIQKMGLPTYAEMEVIPTDYLNNKED